MSKDVAGKAIETLNPLKSGSEKVRSSSRKSTLPLPSATGATTSSTRPKKERAASVDNSSLYGMEKTVINNLSPPNPIAAVASPPTTPTPKEKRVKKEKKNKSHKKDKRGKDQQPNEEGKGRPANGGPAPLLYFSTSSVPTVTHPELPAQLDKFLVTRGMEAVAGLVTRLRVEDVSDVCSDLSIIFEVHGQTQRLIQWAVRKELAATNASAESTLFRQTGVATCLVSIECKRKGSDYLVDLLRPLVQKICNETKSMEVDPLRLRASSLAEDLDSNRRRLVEASQDALDLIFASASSFPESLKHTFLIAHNEILQKLPNMRWAAISNFYFLRFVAPALVSPKASGLYEGNPSPQALRALMLISKTLSNAANGVTFGDKEGYMSIMNSVILNNQPRMSAFLEKLISAPSEEQAGAPASLAASFPPQSDIHMARCRLLAAFYSHRNAILPALMATPSPVPGWTPPARMTSSGNNSSAPLRSGSTAAATEERKGASGEASPVASGGSEGEGQVIDKNEATLGEMLGQLLDAYRVHCPDWVSDEDKKIKKRVQDELLERFEEGLARTMRPVTPVAVPSGHLLRLLLDVEKQRTKELEEELRIIKLKLNTETQAKRDLQLQILRGNSAPPSNGPSAGWVRERQRVAGQFVQMYDMLSTFRGRIVDLERLVLNDAATEGGSGGPTTPPLRTSNGQEQPIPGSTMGTALLSPRTKAGKLGKDPKKAQKRRSWNLKLGNPLVNNT